MTLPSPTLNIALDNKGFRCSIAFLKENDMTNLNRTMTFKHLVSRLIRDESGQDLIEYALVAAIIALGATAAMTTLAGSITSAFTKIGTSLSSAV